jgi:DNA-binding transcriptional MerR regulator
VQAYPLRMRELVSRTGISSPSIHFYARQGLLPPMHKTAGNQARYSEAAVGRLEWIRSLQNELRLPLRSIHRVLERWGQLPIVEIRALQALGRLLEEHDSIVGREELGAVRSRLGPRDLDDLIRLGLIGTQAAGAVSTQELRLLDLCAALRAAGFTDEAGFEISQIGVYRDAVERLVGDELGKILEPVLSRHEPAELRDFISRGLPLANQLLCLLHDRAVRAELQRWLELDTSEADRTPPEHTRDLA